jgi:hypothetical protein
MNSCFSSVPLRRSYPVVILIAALASGHSVGPSKAGSGKHSAPRPESHSRAAVLDTYVRVPLSFEANRGQTDSRVDFLARGSGYTVFLAPSEAVLSLRGAAKVPEHPNSAGDRGAALRIQLVGASRATRGKGGQRLPGQVNYIIGSDPARWRTAIPTYARVAYEEVYPGVDLVYYGNQRQLEYDFIVRPGADPRAIALQIEGADKLDVDALGDLVLHVGSRQIRQRKPLVYQEAGGVRREIAARYERQGSRRVKFHLASYDPDLPLVIDPVLVYSTFLGGGSDELGYGVAIDASGNAYVSGYTLSSDFPTTTGAYDPSDNAGSDAFVTKLDSTAATLVYSTFLGGSNNDLSNGIAVDATGSAYLIGHTDSSDFPTTAGAYDTSWNGGGFDAFVTKLDATGAALAYSTFLGGALDDLGRGVAVDATGSAVVTGRTSSSNFPTTAGAYDTSSNGTLDAFVTKLDATGATLAYSTFLGGTSFDTGERVTIDAAANAYVTGYTASSTFPTTAGAYDTGFNGSFDAFVSKLDAAGATLAYSTFLGGSSFDFGSGVAVDATGSAHVTGHTFSADFSTTAGAYDTSSNGGYDAFVTKLDPTGATLAYSTFLGGSADDFGTQVAVDEEANAYVTGYTASSDFPATALAPDPTHNGNVDAFVTKLDPAGATLTYSTFLGGADSDFSYGLAVDPAGNAYVAGYTSSSDFPTTVGAYDASHNGTVDVFVAKIGGAGAPAVLSLSPATDTNTAGEAHCVTAAVADAAGNPVPDVIVRFSVSGANSASGSATTDANGEATFCHTGTHAGTDAITAYADTDDDETQDEGEPAGAATKTYTPGAPAEVIVMPATDTNAAGEQHCVTATVSDAFGNPVPGVTARFSVSGANTAAGAATTGANGEARFCYTGTKTGQDTIIAFADTDNGGTQNPGEPAGAAEKTYVAAAPATVTLDPETDANPVDSQHCVTATVRDAFGNPTPGIVVRFTVRGSVSATGSATTNAAGEATFCYAGPLLPGEDAITAYADTDNDGAQGPAEPGAAAAKTWLPPASTPLCEIKISSGGRITAANGDTATFGGNARLEADEGTPGQEEYHDHGPVQPMKVKSIEVVAVMCDDAGREASIYGHATIDGKGSFFYRIKVKDLAEAGTGQDTYWIVLQNGYDSGEQVLEGGNVQVRQQ